MHVVRTLETGGLVLWGLKMQVVRTLRWEVLHHGGVGLKVSGGDTLELLLVPWGWELKLQVVGTLRWDVLHHGVGG